MPSLSFRAGLAGALLVAAACRIPEASLEGRRCPCVDDTWVCEATSNTCVRGEVALSSFEVAWTTPNAIGWRWKADNLDRLSAYELIVGTTREAVEGRTAGARVWTGKDNPELAFSYLPRARVADPVLQTLTDEHEPNTTYFGKLVAIDVKGVRSSTTIASGSTTPAPANRITIFSDDFSGRTMTIPDTLVRTCNTPPDAFDRTRCELTFTGACDAIAADAGTCLDNLRIFGVDQPLTAISGSDFDHLAFLEFAMATDPPPQSFWSNVWLAFDDFDEACATCWAFNPWTPRADGNYRRVQIPLRALRGLHDPDAAFTRADLEGRLLTQFAVGGTWVRGTRVRIDEVSIRW
jgi:hypothetical protein